MAPPVQHTLPALVAMLAASVLLLGPTSADAAPPAAASTKPPSAAIAWKACGKQLDCARVRVPLDWSRPGGTTISLAMIRYRASQPKRRIGSLFVNYGGPGVAGVATVRGVGKSLDELARGRFDIVGWDPRGTGESTHVSCFANQRARARFWGANWTIPTTPAESSAYVPKTVAFARRCAARNGPLLQHISTADTVRDLDHLRKLVGDRKINYRGLSYGTFLGQTYANMFPHRVRSMILDSVQDPVKFTTSLASSIASAAADSDLVIEKFMSLCEQAGPSRCALAGRGPVAARVQGLLARLRRGPIPAPSAPAPHQLTYGDTLIALWLAEGTPANWPTLAAALDQAADGDGSALARSVAESRGLLQEALDPATALQCADKRVPRRGAIEAWPRVVDRISDRATAAQADVWWLWAPCASWRVRSADRYTGPWDATTEHPILILSNRYDPRTAYANARAAARRLGNAVLLTNDGYGHTTESDPSSCIDAAIGRYLTALATPRDGTVCRPDRRPFDPDFGEPVPTRAAAPSRDRGGLRPMSQRGLRAIVQKAARELDLPGAVVRLRTPRGVFTASYGTTRLGVRSLPRASTHFRIASITKTMTSAVILQLAQEGKLRLSDPVSKYVPGVPNGDRITIALLLRMRSGLFDYTSTPEMAPVFDNDPTKVWTPQELLAISFLRPPNFAPGTDYEYSNTNYALLGLIIERVDRRSLQAAMKKRLFEPLGLKNTVLPSRRSNRLPEPFAHGYLYGSSTAITTGIPDPQYTPEYQAAIEAGTVQPEDYTDVNHSFATAAGGAISTADDLDVWIRAMVGGRVLGRKYQRLWRASIRPTGQPGMDYGFGINRLHWGPNEVFLHGGETVGYNSEAAYDPTNKLTLVVWTNLTISPRGGLTANRLMLDVLDRAYKLSPLAPGAVGARSAARGSD